MTLPPADSRFRIDVPDAVLDDLRRRLRATRFAPDPDNDDQHHGVSTAQLRPLVDHWARVFDWRAVERELNADAHHRFDVEGTSVHVVLEPGKGPSPIPLLLLHGWPWSFRDWSRVAGPLADPGAHGGDPADAFDVVVASLPGFGFSTPVADPHTTFVGMAETFHTLMTGVLGHRRYAAAGGDYGGLVASQLGHRHADRLYGIHLGAAVPLTLFQSERPWDITEGRTVPPDAPPRVRAGLLNYQETYAGHVAAHMLDGQTLTHGLNDSPAGMLAWLLARWRKWSDRSAVFEEVFPVDHILTTATIYWVTQTIGSSIRIYRNTSRHPWVPAHDRHPRIGTPAGFTLLGGDAARVPQPTSEAEIVAAFERSPARRWFDPVNVKGHLSGGHFGPWENPGAWIDDLRDTFRALRP